MNIPDNLFTDHVHVTKFFSSDFILLKSEYKLIKTWISDIQFIVAMKDYSQVFVSGKTKPLITLQNLRHFEIRLSETGFIRVHRSYMIALRHIDSVSKAEIMIGKHAIPIGVAYRENLKNKLAPFL